MDFLASLRMTLHVRESCVYPVSNGIPFLGFRQYPSHRLIKSRNGYAFSRRFRKMKRQVTRGSLTLETMQTRVQGWIAHASHANTWGLRLALFHAALPIEEGGFA